MSTDKKNINRTERLEELRDYLRGIVERWKAVCQEGVIDRTARAIDRSFFCKYLRDLFDVFGPETPGKYEELRKTRSMITTHFQRMIGNPGSAETEAYLDELFSRPGMNTVTGRCVDRADLNSPGKIRDFLKALYRGMIAGLEMDADASGVSFGDRPDPTGKELFMLGRPTGAGIRDWFDADLSTTARQTARLLCIGCAFEQAHGIKQTLNDRYESFVLTPWDEWYSNWADTFCPGINDRFGLLSPCRDNPGDKVTVAKLRTDLAHYGNWTQDLSIYTNS